jgi:hypothetical protein
MTMLWTDWVEWVDLVATPWTDWAEWADPVATLWASIAVLLVASQPASQPTSQPIQRPKLTAANRAPSAWAKLSPQKRKRRRE